MSRAHTRYRGAASITKTSKRPSVGEAPGVSVRNPRYVSTLATVTTGARASSSRPSTSTRSDGSGASTRKRRAIR